MNIDYNKNFSKTAQGRFEKFASNTNWSWIGLSMALIKRFGLKEVEEFHFILGEALKKIRKDI